MAGCIDKKYEQMIHAYELGTLPDEDRQAFELHLLECQSCFEAVQKFEDTSRLLRGDSDVRSAVREVLDEEERESGNEEKVTPISSIRRKPRWVTITAFAAAAVLLLVLRPWRIEIHPTDEVMAAENRLAIMPFDNLASPEDPQQLGRIISSLLVSDLSESQFINVVSSQHLADVTRLVSMNGEPLERTELLDKVTDRVGARWRLTGSVLQDDSAVVLVWELTDVESRNVLASKRVSGEPGQDIFSLVDMLTVAIKENLPLPLSAAREPDPMVADVTTHSPEAYRYYLDGLDAYSRLYFDEARISFRKAIEYDSTFAMAHFRLTLCLPYAQRAESIAKAVKYSEGASRKEKLLIRALHASIDGNYYLYIDNLKAIAKDYPDDKEVVYWLGSYYFSEAEFDQSTQYLKRAVEIDPLYKNPYNLLAYAYARVGDMTNSIQAINKYIELAPGEANPYDSRGDLYLLMNNPEAAMESFQKAVDIRRSFADYSPLTKIGRLHLVQGRYEEARTIFQELAGAEGDGVRACGRFMLSYIPLRQGQFGQALEILDNAVSADVMEHGTERFPTNHLQKALIYQQTGELDLALEEIERCQKIYADVHNVTVTSYEHLHAQLLAETGRPDSARSVAERTLQELERDSSNLQVYWLALGSIALAEGDAAKAVEFSEKAAEGYVYSFAAHYILGRAYLQAGGFENAAETLSGLHQCYESGRTFWGPWDVNSHYYLAIAYEGLGEIARAMTEYETFLGFWKEADRDLVEVRDAETRLERLKSAG